MIADKLPELANSKYKSLKDATSGYWHVLLDLASSLMITFNAPWGKLRWLHLPMQTMEIEHDGRLLTLFETARMNNLSFNPIKIQFKSTDCKFFGH